MAQLIVESALVKPIRKVEEDTESGRVTFEAVVSEVDFVNGNNRLYPREVMWPAFEDLMQNPARYPGLVDHPDYYAPASVTDNGVRWQNFWMEGNQIIGKGVVIPTAKGKDLAATLLAEVEVGFSTRGYGETEQIQMEGRTVNKMVKYSFKPDGSIDAVSRPSVDHARVRTVSKEELEVDLEELNSKLAATEAQLAEATQQKDAAEAKLAEVQTQLESANAKVTDLETQLTEAQSALEAEKQKGVENALEAKISKLIGDHKFAPAIRDRLSKLGAVLTVDTADLLVTNVIEMVEAAATTAATQASEPRGIVPDESEDRADEATIDPAVRAEIEAAGLYV